MGKAIKMIKIKTFSNTLNYTHCLIDTDVNKWLEEQGEKIHVIDVKYNVTNDGYESVLVMYEEMEEVKG